MDEYRYIYCVLYAVQFMFQKFILVIQIEIK